MAHFRVPVPRTAGAVCRLRGGSAVDIVLAVKATNSAAWDEAETKIRSTTAINGYVIALRRSLEGHGVLDFAGYKKLLESVDVSFSKSEFPYASSQYAKFSRQILEEAFGVDDAAEEELALPPGEITVTP